MGTRSWLKSRVRRRRSCCCSHPKRARSRLCRSGSLASPPLRWQYRGYIYTVEIYVSVEIYRAVVVVIIANAPEKFRHHKGYICIYTYPTRLHAPIPLGPSPTPAPGRSPSEFFEGLPHQLRILPVAPYDNRWVTQDMGHHIPDLFLTPMVPSIHPRWRACSLLRFQALTDGHV